MSIANKYNHSKFTFKPARNTPFVTLEELYKEFGASTVYPVKACYINKKSKFGDHGVVATGNYMVDMPKHLTNTISEIMLDNETIEAINTGHFGFSIYVYAKDNGEFFSVHWEDID